MLTQEEQDFIRYWEENRTRRKKFLKQLVVGLPLGVLFALAVFINFASGWDKRVNVVLSSYPSLHSLIIVLLLAIIVIVVFISVFSTKVKWEKNEQYYRELLSRKDNDIKI